MTVKDLFYQVRELGEGDHGQCSIHMMSEVFDDITEVFRIYHKKGHCFEISKDQYCSPDECDEYEEIDGLCDDGAAYVFTDLSDLSDVFVPVTLKQLPTIK